MYIAKIYVSDLSGKHYPDKPQFIYTGKNDVMTMLLIDLELQLFSNPAINRKCERITNIDTEIITFESSNQKTVYTIPI